MGGIASSISEKAEQIPTQMTERQKGVQLAVREVQMASAQGRARDDFKHFICPMHGTLFTLLTVGAIKTHNPALIVPLVPITTSFFYIYDMAYGNKFERIRLEAEEILKHERQNFLVPNGNKLMSQEAYRDMFYPPTHLVLDPTGAGRKAFDSSVKLHEAQLENDKKV